MSTDLLRVADLSVGYSERRSAAVRQVSLTVRAGEFHGLVGESGSGKSTIARTLLGLTDRGGRVLAGSVVIDGVELLGLSNRRLRRVRGPKVAYIGQNPFGALHPVLSIDRQFDQMRRAHRGLLSRGAGHSRAVDLLEQVGIRDPASVLQGYVHQLSGGMAQRIVIAMAMFLDPQLIVADEPTTGLDVTIQRQILDLLTAQARARGVGLLLITHDLGVVAQYCDTMTVLYGGRVMEAGPVGQVLTQPTHPYTRALVAAVPVPGAPLATTAASNYPVIDDGCPFRERCPMVEPVCSTALTIVDIAPGWQAHCHAISGAK